MTHRVDDALLESLADIDGRTRIEDALARAHSTFFNDFHGLEIYDGHVKGKWPGIVFVVGVDVGVPLQVPVYDLFPSVGKGIAFVVGVQRDVVLDEFCFQFSEPLEPRGTTTSMRPAVGDNPTTLAGEV